MEKFDNEVAVKIGALGIACERAVSALQGVVVAVHELSQYLDAPELKDACVLSANWHNNALHIQVVGAEETECQIKADQYAFRHGIAGPAPASIDYLGRGTWQFNYTPAPSSVAT